ncbi:MAG: hypothetical protein J6B55_00455, partial [Clostridia bacterium]|nr:hypothetical protein [Clostridia bacterium]
MSEQIILCDQMENKVVVYDTADLMTPVWSWKTDHECMSNVSGVKKRVHPLYGEVVLVCASGGYCAMVSYPKGEILWESVSKGNCHSIELLPSGKIATASSDGNIVRLFGSPDEFISVEAEYSHGVLYDPERDSLWVLERNRICECDPDTLEIKGNVCDFRDILDGGHDLAPCYGDTNLLWLTGKNGIFLYNKSDNKVSIAAGLPQKSVKGVGNTPETNRVFAMWMTGVYKPWCTDEIHYFKDGTEQ